MKQVVVAFLYLVCYFERVLSIPNTFTSYCSEINSNETFLIDLSQVNDGNLDSHRPPLPTIFYINVPLRCQWYFTTTEPGQWRVKIRFESLKLPEPIRNPVFNTGMNDGDGFGYSLDSFNEDKCGGNYVKINYENDTDTLGTYCGTGWAPDLITTNSQPFFITVQLLRPFIEFRIHFELLSGESRINGDKNVDRCDGVDFIKCQGSSGRCIPRSYLCDQRRDCPFGEDELNCAVGEVVEASVGEDSITSSIGSGCGSLRYLSGSSGSFTSMNYPCNYANNSRCIWYINTNPDKVIFL